MKYGTGTWNNIEGHFYIECGFVEGRLINIGTEKELGEDITLEVRRLFESYLSMMGEESVYFEINIEFSSSGYYDPGRISGPPEDCYPPEYDDERTFENAKIKCMFTSQEEDSIGIVKQLPFDIGDKLFAEFEEEIMDVELDFTQYDDSGYLCDRMKDSMYD